MNNKTVQQIVDEYRNRQEKPEHLSITLTKMSGDTQSYRNVTNIREVYDNGVWLEFDSIYNGISKHNRILGAHIVGYVDVLEKLETREIIGDCISVIIYTSSGDHEPYINIQNLVWDKDSRIIEFDHMRGGECSHRKMSGAIERYDKKVM